MRRPALLAAGCFLLLSSCSSESPDSGDAGRREQRKFAVTYQTLNNPFFKDLHDGLLSVIRERGDSLDLFDASFDAQNQSDQLGDMIVAGYDGIFVNPVNWKGIGRSLHKAKSAGIPCVVVDAPVQDMNLVVTTVASDNYQAGVLAGGALKKARPDGAKVITLSYSVNKACRDRIAGFMNSIEGDDSYTVVSSQDLKAGTQEAAYPVMKDLLLRSPDVTAVFAINDPAAFGVIRALEDAEKLSRVSVLAVDGSRKAVEEIKKGRLLGTSAQFPVTIGRRAAEALYAHLEGQPVSKEIKVPVELVDASNAERFEKLGDGS